MKIYMHWDMEGASGLYHREQTWFWEAGVRQEAAEEGQALLIADVNACVAAALDAGADEVIVCDTHGGGGNIQIGRMLKDPRVTYHVKPRERQGTLNRWMPGLDESVDGLMLMGHHAKSGTPDAFLPHTWMMAWADFRINGLSVGEIGIESCYAGHWNVPLILAEGDEATGREVAEQFPEASMAVVKRVESHDRCTGPAPEEGRKIAARKVVEAIERTRVRRPAAFRPALPMTITIQMKEAKSAEAAAQKPNVKRLDECTVETTIERYCDVVKWITNTGMDVVERR